MRGLLVKTRALFWPLLILYIVAVGCYVSGVKYGRATPDWRSSEELFGVTQLPSGGWVAVREGPTTYLISEPEVSERDTLK